MQMDEQKEVSASPREMLEALLSPEFVKKEVDVLAHAATPDDLTREFNARHYTCDAEQFLFPLFRPLYEQLPEVQADTMAELESSGLPPELIYRYLTAMGDQPYVVLALRRGDIPPDTRIKLSGEVRRVMFDTLKRKLGIPTIVEPQA